MSEARWRWRWDLPGRSPLLPNSRLLGLLVGATLVAGGSCGGLQAAGGRVVAWGRNVEGQCNAPANATNLVALAANAIHTLALRDDGSLLAWGSPESRPPAGVSGLVRISAANLHSAGLRADGTVLVWSAFPSLTNVPAAATNIVDISVGNLHVLALRRDGRVVAWGENYWGQLDVPASATNVVAIAAGGVHGLALCADGRLLEWGAVEYVPAGATNLAAIATTFDRCLALRRDGTVLEWQNSDLPVPVAATNIVAIAGGAAHWLALRQDGTVVSWDLAGAPATVAPPGLASVAAVAGGGDHSLALTDYRDPGVFLFFPGGPALAGDGVLLRAEPRGLRPASLRWLRNGSALAGATDASLFFSDVQAADAGAYTLEAAYSGGTAVSGAVSLAVAETPPRSPTPAASIGLIPGKPLRLSAQVRGTEPIGFQWRKDGVDLPGATNAWWSVPAVAWGDAGVYVLEVSNRLGVLQLPPQTFSVIHVAAWGWNPLGEIDVPPSATSLVAIAAGVNHSLALRDDGTLLGWGDNTFGQIVPPAAASNVVALAAGGGQSLCARADGTLIVWGSNVYGQTNAPPGATNVVAVAAGEYHSLALRRDGRVVAWGGDFVGQCAVPDAATNVVSIAARGGHNLALRADGAVIAWGASDYGLNDVPAAATNVVALAPGGAHNLVLRADGSVVGWGSNQSGETTVPAAATNLVSVAAFGNHCLAARADGQVLDWGGRDFPELVIPAQATNALAVAAGSGFDLALLGRGVFRLWRAPIGMTAHAGDDLVLQAAAFGRAPVRFQWRRGGVPLAGATNAWLVLDNVQARSAGDYTVEAVSGAESLASTPAPLVVLPAPPTIQVQPASQTALLGGEASFQVVAKGSEPLRYEWQRYGQAVPGGTGAVLRLSGVDPGSAGAYRVVVANELGSATSQAAALAVRELVTWGDNGRGQRAVPATATNVVELAAGTAHTLALRTDGRVVAWGDNGRGQCNVPEAATNVVHVAAHSTRSLAVRRDGALVTWGDGGTGMAAPPAATGVVAAALGPTHSLAVRRDGSVVAWGNNNSGQLAVSAAATTVVALAAGSAHSLALRADGNLAAWGSGVLLTNIPAAATGVVAIATGSAHNLALRADGTAVAWGVNSNGECDVPAHATNLIAVAARDSTSLALRADGQVIAWGAALYDLTKVPDEAARSSAIVLGSTHGVALRYRPAVVFASPQDATVRAGERLVLQASVCGGGPLAAQWYREGQPVADATNRWLALPNVQEAVAGAYTIVFGGEGAALASEPARVGAIPAAPEILGQPASQTNWIGAALALEARILGSEPMDHAWLHDGVRVPGAPGPRLDFPDLAPGDAGGYQLVLSNALGSATSVVASVSVRQVAAWGQNTAGQTNVPASATNVVAIAAGDRHTLALRQDGKVVAWGANTSGQTTLPASATNLVAIAAGKEHSLAARADGTVVAWGSPQYGKTAVPASATGAVAVAAGPNHSLALRNDGRVVAWSTLSSALTNVPAGAVNIARIAASPVSGDYSLALRRDGRVLGWGSGLYGLTNPPTAAANAAAISAGPTHALAIRGDGQPVGWGYPIGGVLNIPPAATNLVGVVAGNGFSLALRNDGVILAWGATGQPVAAQLPASLSSAFTLGAGSVHGVAATASRAPRFVDRLGDLVAYEGRDFSLNALAVGRPPLAYQWRFDGADLPGATQPTLTLSAVRPADAGIYSVVVSNLLGVLEGEVARVTVEPAPSAPTILQSPASLSAMAGTNVSFVVSASGYPAPTFQWQRDGVNLYGATNPVYVIPYVLANHAGVYRVVASNSEASAASDPATLTVEVPPWPTLSALPQGRAVPWGAPMGLTAAVNGTPPVHIQWRRNGADLPGMVGPSLTLASFQDPDGGIYSVAMSNAFGVVESPGVPYVPCPVAVWGTGPVTTLPLSLSNAVAIAAGDSHALALKADGTVAAWGVTNPVEFVVPPGVYVTNDYGQLRVPPGLTGVVAIAAGRYHNLALKEDGTVTGWGLNDAGQASVPPTATNVIAIAAGYACSLALRADGSVLAWGTNQYSLTNVPSSAVNIVAIAAGTNHCLALRADGEPVTWGAPLSGAPLPLTGKHDLVAIASGPDFALGLRRDGTRLQWGRFPATYVASSMIHLSSFDAPNPDSGYAALAAGRNHSLLLRNDGSVVVFSRTTFGPAAPRELVPSWVRNLVALAAGPDYSLGLMRPPGGLPSLQTRLRRAYTGGTAVFAAFGPGQRVTECQWTFQGTDLAGAAGPFLVLSNTPPEAAGLYVARISDAAGSLRSDDAGLEIVTPPLPRILRQPQTLTVGAGTDVTFSVLMAPGVPASLAWQFNSVDLPGETRPVLFLPAVQAHQAGEYCVVARNAGGALTSQVATLTVVWTPPAILTEPADATATAGDPLELSVTARGAEPLCYQWEFEGVPRAGATGSVLTLPAVTQAEVGAYRVVVTNEWGAATSAVAQVYLPPVSIWGDRAAFAGNPPVGSSNLIALSAGGGHVLGLREDGQVVAWGANGCGQATVPAEAVGVVQVSAGELHSLALRSDGTVLGWGAARFGGSVPAASLSNIVQVSAGPMLSLALDAAGQVYAWDQTAGFRREPVSNAVAVAAGGRHQVAVVRDGTVQAWGLNSSGQTAVPAEATNAVAVAAGLAFSAALRADGQVLAWGDFAPPPSELSLTVSCGGYSYSYSGTSKVHPLPVPAEATNVVALAAGRHHLVALRSDGQVIAWGENNAGQLDVPPLEGVLTVAAGGDLSLALHGDPAARFGDAPATRTAGEAEPLVFNLAPAGRPPFAQRWQIEGEDLPGETNRFLYLKPGQARSGAYRALLENAFGSGEATVALTVNPAPPAVVIRPGWQLVQAGADVVFAAEAGGSAPLAYQWLQDGALLADSADVEGSRGAVLTLRGVAPFRSAAYSVVVSNVLGAVTSAEARLVVLTAPPLAEALDATNLVWTTGGDTGWRWQADNTHNGPDAAASGPSLAAGTNWVRTTVSGPVAVGFWWTLSGSFFDRLAIRLDGQEMFSIGYGTPWQARSLMVPSGDHVVEWVHLSQPSSSLSQAVLDEVTLGDPRIPVVTSQPVPRSAIEGGATSFSVTASGTEPLAYQWMFEGEELPGATNAFLTLSGVRPDQTGEYRALVSNAGGRVASEVADLTLTPSAPQISPAPQAQVVARGLDAAFSAGVLGTTPMTLQWQFDRADIPGAVQVPLGLAAVNDSNAGVYRLIARNEFGTAVSAEVPLVLVPVAAWGTGYYGETTVPADVGDAVEVAAGDTTSLVRRRDGSLRFWGGYRLPAFLVDAQAPDGPFLSVKSAGDHHLALRADGTVAAWGRGDLGLSPAPPSLGRAVAVAAGARHNLALLADGTLTAWGENLWGQCAAPVGASNLVAVAGGSAHSLALRDDGTVLAWGLNDRRQLEVPAGLSNAIAVAAGAGQSLALREDGAIVCWGDADPPPAGLTAVVALAAGTAVNLALQADGTVVQWGTGVAPAPAGLSHVVALAGGQTHALAIVGRGEPVITVPPFHRRFLSAGELVLHVRAVGAAPLQYQWFHQGQELPGATEPTLRLAGSPAQLAGTYRVRVANRLGTVESTPSEVVVPPPELRFDIAASALRLDAAGLHLRLQGLSGRGTVRVWAADRLGAWELVLTHPPAAGGLEVLDASATGRENRWYYATEGD